MSKSLILTEKPSQGREMAAGIGETFTKTNGYMESPSYVVTWAIGHLIEPQMPAAYNPAYEKWNFADLPIIPEDFKYAVKAETSTQFNIIKSLLNRKDIDRVIEAGDPGREGELISRLILLLCGNKKPIYRFWVTMALDASTIRKGMAALKSASDYDGLYHSARVRQMADWLIGINATRAITIKFNETCSVGRVQTPTLALIVKREKEIKAFVPKDFWTVSAIFSHVNGTYVGQLKTGEEAENEEQSGSRFMKKSDAEDVVAALKGASARIVTLKAEKKSEKPPLLFSLTELQIQANKLFGLTADEALKIAQELYETDKATSYPRTESKHLSTNLVQEVPGILQKLTAAVTFDMSKCTVDGADKRVFDDSKFTDHHAIIPTGHIPENMSGNKKSIYTLICECFIAAFYPDFQYMHTQAVTEAAGYSFTTGGKTVITPGWREIHGKIPKDEALPALKQGDTAALAEVKLSQGKTTAAPRYSESDILKAMENISRHIEDEAYKKVLKESSGLGTPATRAAILETLKKRYLSTEKNKLIPNETALKLMELLKDSAIADPLYTAQMEQELEEIAYHGKSPEAFMQSAMDYTSEFVKWISSLTITPMERQSKYPVICRCPLCGGDIIAYPKVYSCANTKDGKCKMSLWRNSLQKLGKETITEKEATKLITGQPLTVNLKKGNKKYSAPARLEATEKGYYVKVIFE